MDRFALKIFSKNQAARIRFVAWIIFDDLTLQHTQEDFIKCKGISLRLLVRMVGDAYAFLLKGGDDVLDIHGC